MKITRLIAWVLAAVPLTAVLVAAGCGSTSTASTSPTPSTAGTGGMAAVSIKNYAFTPAKLVVRPGTTVTWTDNDAVPHTVTAVTAWSGTGTAKSGVFDSGTIQPGAQFTFTFNRAGAYRYQCAIHYFMARMHGVVIVSATKAMGGSSVTGPSGPTPSGFPSTMPSSSPSAGGGAVPGY
jgi:plastocyanin